MSADGSIEFAWADGTHRFRLGLGELCELQEKINKPRIAMGAQPIGPWSLLQLARTGDLWPNDIREIVRLGLIGAGKNPLDALALVMRYIDTKPMMESLPFVTLILMAAISGVPGDEVGKKPEAEMDAKNSEQTGSPSPQSMEPELPLGGPLGKLTKHHFGNSQPPLMDGIMSTAPDSKS